MKTFLEAKGDTAVFTFGRFNPPTTGHEKLIDALAREQGKNSGAPMYVYPSHSQNPKKDPLPHNKKVAYMKKMFPKYKKNIKVSRARNVFDIAVELHNKGHKAIVMVVGSDRVDEFANLLDKYNGVDGRHGFYGFDDIKVVSAGERDPDAEGVTGMSASKMRAAAGANEFDQFKLGLPKGFKDGEKLFKDVRTFMGIKEEYNFTLEELNRDLYIRGEIWNVGDVVKTTDGDEGTIIRKGTNYVVFEDLRRVWLHNLEEVKQDKDIKDKEGTQPAKYYAKDADGDEMSVSTKKKRASHFAKKKSGPAPGDANADTKPSKHTKKFKDMFGERAKNAVAGNKVQKLVTAHGLKFKGKVYKEIDMELKGIDNNTQMVTFNIIHPKEIFGNEVKVAFKVLRRGPFMATDTSKINEDDGCWDTHKQVGMKKKNGKMVPNCVPKEEIELDEKIAGLVTKAEKSGMPYGILKKVYDRGMAAYKTGHRPGTTAQQWAFARVNSFTTKSSGTWGKADADLAAKVRGSSKKEVYEIGKDYGDHTRKVTPGQSATKESVEEWYLDENTRDKYEERFGDNWLAKLTETYNKMLSKLPCCDDCDGLYEHTIVESEYQGKKVKLNDPIRTSENPNKKFKVYVKNEKGKVVVVRFGDPNMSINRDDPKARKSFRARHGCDTDPGPKWKAKYWSCYQWRGGAKVDN